MMTKLFWLARASLMLVLLSMPAWCCGSMPGFWLQVEFYSQLIASLSVISVMAFLVPVEILIIRFVGLEDTGYTRSCYAYGYCLLAKIAGLAVIATFMMDIPRGSLIVEGTYSILHFMFALAGFITFFNIEWRRAMITALLISTIIPWPVSAVIRYFVVQLT